MSYNIEVLVLKQEKIEKIPFSSKIDYVDIYEEKDRLSFTNWSFMAIQKGIWYTLGVYDEDGDLWAFPMLDTDFDKLINQDNYSWIEDKDYLENFTPLRVKSNYLDDFKKILEYLIDLSPIKTIMMYARYQGGDEEIIQGPIPFEKYMEMLQNDQVPFNVCTIIKK